MDGESAGGWLWAVVIIGGPVAMGLVLAFVALSRRRARKRGEVAESQHERLDREKQP